MTGEFELIGQYFKPLAGGDRASLGLTDDAAVLSPPAGSDLVLTADCMSAGIHFLESDPPAAIARKLLRVNLSDLAAMGGKPLGYLLTLALPGETRPEWVEAFAQGLADDQQACSITLLGGDTTRTKGPLCLSITAIGLVPSGRGLKRSTAADGDLVFVSGSIGDGHLGLRFLKHEFSCEAERNSAYLSNRYRLPRPRLDLGRALLAEDLATAAIDVSDGLVADLGHIASESGLAARLESAAVPLSDAARHCLEVHGVPLEALLTGGDDYELLFTVPEQRADEVVALSASLGLALTRVGMMRGGKGVEVTDTAGRPLSIAQQGWVHF